MNRVCAGTSEQQSSQVCYDICCVFMGGQLLFFTAYSVDMCGNQWMWKIRLFTHTCICIIPLNRTDAVPMCVSGREEETRRQNDATGTTVPPAQFCLLCALLTNSGDGATIP